MISIRNILVTMAFLSAAPISFAAPAAESTSTAQYNADVPANVDTISPINIDDVNDVDARDVLNILENREVKCGITSAPGKNCQYSACPPAEYCKVSTAGNCVWKKASSRPSGCLDCKCYKTSM